MICRRKRPPKTYDIVPVRRFFYDSVPKAFSQPVQILCHRLKPFHPLKICEFKHCMVYEGLTEAGPAADLGRAYIPACFVDVWPAFGAKSHRRRSWSQRGHSSRQKKGRAARSENDLWTLSSEDQFRGIEHCEFRNRDEVLAQPGPIISHHVSLEGGG